MTFDPMWMWIALGTVGALIVIGLFVRGSRRSRSETLRSKFGSEYDHAVKEKGWREGERQLITRAEEVERFPIRSLTAAERDRFRIDWALVEKHFLDRPTMAVVEADELVAELMRSEGYPMGDFDKHAAHLAVNHSTVVHHYRAGHEVIEGAPGSASTEDLRQAMLHYRALFDELIGDRASDHERDIPRANEVVTPIRREEEEEGRRL
jgi:hypothetical protein